MGSLEAQGWMGLKLYVTVKVEPPVEGEPTTKTIPVGDWAVAEGEPQAVSSERVHILGWEVDDTTLIAKPVFVNVAAVADAVVGPNGSAFLYHAPGDPSAGGEYLRDEGEVKATYMAALKKAWDDAGSNIDGDAPAREGDEGEDRPKRGPIPRTFPKHKGKGK